MLFERLCATIHVLSPAYLFAEVAISLPSRTLPPIPDQTLRVARAAFPKGSFALHLRDLLPDLYTDACVRNLYPPQGQPAFAAWRLILVTTLQFTEDLTDRQAAEAVCARIDWKCALQAARAHQATGAFKAEYAARAGVEGLLGQGVKVYGLRRSQYLGQAKTHLQHVVTAVALTLVRVVSWVRGAARSGVRDARFVSLMPAGLVPASG